MCQAGALACFRQRISPPLCTSLTRRGWRKEEDGISANLGNDWPPAKLGFRTADRGSGGQLQEKQSPLFPTVAVVPP